MSNHFAERIAELVDPLMPSTITVRPVKTGALPGHVVWSHEDGAQGLIDLFHVKCQRVDNRRVPDGADRDRLIELIVRDAGTQVHDPGFTVEAHNSAAAAYEAVKSMAP